MSLVGVFGKRLQTDAFQLGGNCGIDVTRWRWFCLTNPLEKFELIVTAKWTGPDQQFVKHRSQAIDIAAAVNTTTLASSSVRDSCRPAFRRTLAFHRRRVHPEPVRNQRDMAHRFDR